MSTDSTTSLIELFLRAKLMRDALGASPYGGDLNKFPARMVDAFVILEQERLKVERLMSVSDQPPQRK